MDIGRTTTETEDPGLPIKWFQLETKQLCNQSHQKLTQFLC